ncbi:MAG TPA: hypothetical protein VL625_00605 [Patescibacteria group bacterium]|nr:hypothetical protein [Patescibacteria group bacterium]
MSRVGRYIRGVLSAIFSANDEPEVYKAPLASEWEVQDRTRRRAAKLTEMIATYDDVVHHRFQGNEGALRGKPAFVLLLGLMSDLRIHQGLDPEREESYAALNTTKAAFKDLLQAEYRRASWENIEDALDRKRQPLDVLSDLHLVPAYMELGGLDPKQEPWPTNDTNRCYYSQEFYEHLKGEWTMAEAQRLYNMARDRRSGDPAGAKSALEGVQYRLKEAGPLLKVSGDELYAQLDTTAAKFGSFLAEMALASDRKMRGLASAPAPA